MNDLGDGIIDFSNLTSIILHLQSFIFLQKNKNMNLMNLKLIWRNLLKNKGITSINIFGLSVSLAVATLIVLFLQFEYSFDTFHANQNDIYRLNTTFKYPNSPERPTAMASSPMGPYLARESNEVESYLRVMNGNEDFLCKANKKEVVIGKSLLVDSTFFDFFDFKLLHGNEESLFDKLENILIVNTISEQLFGTENPIGNTLQYTYALDANRDTTIHYVIAGVLEDVPKNSHLQFEAIVPLDGRQFDGIEENNRWHGISTSTYFKLRKGIDDPNKVAENFPTLLEKEMPNPEMVRLSLQALSAIHLDSGTLQFDSNNYEKSERKYLQVFGLVALFLLLISSMNFANLSTVLAMRRTQEVGVRKSLGANGSEVLVQFLGEAVLMSFIGGSIALLWVYLLKEPFLMMLDREIDLFFNPTILMIYFIGILLLGLLAGIFPAVQAARYSAVEAFNKLGTAVSVKRPFIQRLVVVQFMLSGLLIISSLICYQQVNYLQNKELGFDYNQVLEIDLGYGNSDRAEGLKKEIASLADVLNVSGSNISLGTFNGQSGVMVRTEKTNEWENFPMPISSANHNYFDLYEMQFVHGQSPSPESEENGQAFVVNESFVKKVGWKENPIGKPIRRFGFNGAIEGKVVGVIKDIHHNTLHNAIESVCLYASSFSPVLSLKVNMSNLEKLLPQIEMIWNRHIKDSPFEYRFMDAHLTALYDSEYRLGQLLLLATILSILIACLGLLALSAFIIQQRTKEIGIRKILGASAMGILGLLSKDFVKLVLIAFVVISPIAWYVMNNWLQNFAYHIEISWWIFALAGIAAVFIAFCTVSIQSLKVAFNNPVESLRDE